MNTLRMASPTRRPRLGRYCRAGREVPSGWLGVVSAMACTSVGRFHRARLPGARSLPRMIGDVRLCDGDGGRLRRPPWSTRRTLGCQQRDGRPRSSRPMGGVGRTHNRANVGCAALAHFGQDVPVCRSHVAACGNGGRRGSRHRQWPLPSACPRGVSTVRPPCPHRPGQGALTVRRVRGSACGVSSSVRRCPLGLPADGRPVVVERLPVSRAGAGAAVCGSPPWPRL